jgi:hypothetical protein
MAAINPSHWEKPDRVNDPSPSLMQAVAQGGGEFMPRRAEKSLKQPASGYVEST